jgi:hypothetical protein
VVGVEEAGVERTPEAVVVGTLEDLERMFS